MIKKLTLISVLFLCLLGFMVVPILNPGQAGMARPGEGFSFVASPAYAQNSQIMIEGADAVWEPNTQPSEGLVRAAEGVPARILAEYADSVLSLELQKSEQLSLQAATVSPRILVEYADSILSLNLEPPVPLVQPTTPTPTSPPEPGPTPTPTRTPEPSPTPIPEQPVLEPGQPYVDLYGHMTDIIVGDEIILYLSVVNPITSPGTLVVQLTLRIPSGWSITSSGFAHGAGGLRTNTYEIGRGPNPQEIDVHILANEPYEGDVMGYMDYYFKEEAETKYHNEARLPVTAKLAQPTREPPSELVPVTPSPTPWWLQPQWLVPVIIAGLACIIGVIRLIIRVTRGP